MSFKVLVIPEDFTKDEHVLKPLVERMLGKLGYTPTVEVCRDPNFAGVDAATDMDRLRSDVIARYPMVDLFILLVDRDGNAGREQSAANIETTLSGELGADRRFFAELARQEVEVFVLAGHKLPADWSWNAIRGDADVKNTYFRRFVELKGTGSLPHDGRKKLMQESVTNWNRIEARCQEDVRSLMNRIGAKP